MDGRHDPQLDQALDALRRSLTRPPEEHVAQRHLAAMRDAAGDESPAGWWASLGERSALRRSPMPGLTPRWLVIGAAALLGFTGGLAAADVLPDPAQHLVSQMVGHTGLDLPDPDDDDVGDEGDVTEDSKPDNHGRTVSSVAHDDTLEGCEHGQAVSDVASSKSRGNPDAPGRSDDHDPCDHDDDEEDENEGPGNAGNRGDDDEDENDDDDTDGPGNSGGSGNSGNSGGSGNSGNSGNSGSSGSGNRRGSGDD